MKPIPSKLAKHLRAARLRQGLKLRDIEEHCKGEVSNPYLSQIESGYILDVNPRKLRAIARALKIDYLEVLILAGYLTVRELNQSKGRV